MNEKESWQERVQKEATDVYDRLSRLDAFLDEGGAEAAGVTGKARDLLVEQRFIMRAYYDVLCRRLDEDNVQGSSVGSADGAISGVSMG